MQLTSPAFQNGQFIPSRYTCDGENISPRLVFSDVPPNTVSLALICHDPDAPKEGGWTHWVVFNMAPQSSGIPENAPPTSGIEGTSDFGQTGYGGPCPPNGTHRYNFHLYALDAMLDLNSSATKVQLEKMMEEHILAQASLMGRYERN